MEIFFFFFFKRPDVPHSNSYRYCQWWRPCANFLSVAAVSPTLTSSCVTLWSSVVRKQGEWQVIREVILTGSEAQTNNIAILIFCKGAGASPGSFICMLRVTNICRRARVFLDRHLGDRTSNKMLLKWLFSPTLFDIYFDQMVQWARFGPQATSWQSLMSAFHLPTHWLRLNPAS